MTTRTLNCDVCGKAMQVDAVVTGTPKVSHLNCAMDVTKESRDRNIRANKLKVEEEENRRDRWKGKQE